MPARTKKQREDLIGRFALDLSQRCHAEYKSALKHCDGNFQTFKRKLSHTVDAIILCYQSKHCICKRNSFVCKGIEDPWINKSIYLPKTFKLNLTLKQQSELRKCINYRLGPKELERTKLGTNTQKSECVNRIIRRSLPRSNTFSKNFQGRANSAVSSANHGPGESVMALCLSVGAPVTAGSKVHTHLQQEQKIYENHKQYKKLAKYMKNRKQKAKAKFDLYSKNQEKKGHFSTLKQPDSNRNGSSKGLKVKDVKRTYLRLKKTTQKKVNCIPRSVQLVAANNELPENFETTVLLRPKQDSSFLDCKSMTAENIIRAEQDTYRLVHLQKSSEMWNESFRQHLSKRPTCKGNLQWNTHKEEQRGFVWRATLNCDNCNFISKKYKLYKEVQTTKKGPKPAAINYGMQVGLSQVSMGSSGLRKILLSGNIPAPSTKGMQNSANKVNEKIEIQNVADMADIRTELKTINKMRGHPESHIDVEGDGCYNNPLYSGIGKTPFQPATQSCYVVVENMTDKKASNQSCHKK
ncbi:unnamed protein product [Mytilus edulis]|uniref:Mutator-like transposase domain-containing protein n=1 Tax=Mytilus edulis TaxID=6550 RepID=A0A8S3V301_MYTED|nr:unnamed protein product [Mytilus edulis]